MIRQLYKTSSFAAFSPVAFLLEWASVKNTRHRQAAQLRALTDAQLYDIGISRSMAEAEASRLQSEI